MIAQIRSDRDTSVCAGAVAAHCRWVAGVTGAGIEDCCVLRVRVHRLAVGTHHDCAAETRTSATAETNRDC